MMKRFGMVFVGCASAAPAWAHEGAHLHPHGAGNWLNVVIALVLIGAAGLVAVSRK